MHTLSSEAPALPDGQAAPWVAIAGVAAALALVVWAGPDVDTPTGGAAPLDCRIALRAGVGPARTTLLLVNTTGHALPAGTAWAWTTGGAAPHTGEHRTLREPLAAGAAVQVLSSQPAVALRCRAALLAPVPAAGTTRAGADVASLALDDPWLSPR